MQSILEAQPKFESLPSTYMATVNESVTNAIVVFLTAGMATMCAMQLVTMFGPSTGIDPELRIALYSVGRGLCLFTPPIIYFLRPSFLDKMRFRL